MDGSALDAHGFPCHALACPHCHLGLPRALLETQPAFVSILGAPACGKSFFLAALTGQLRRQLPSHFSLDFADTDPTVNLKLIEYEQALFLNRQAGGYVYLDGLIRKTELQGDLYETVAYGNQTVSYPRPFLFTVTPQARHPAGAAAVRLGRVFCLYDNAGEHFLPGQDTTASPATRHLAQAFLLLFLFDPLQDPRFLNLCRQRGLQLPGSDVLLAGRFPQGGMRQESILLEAAARVRRFLGLAHTARHGRPVLVVVTKSDVWGSLLGPGALPEPYRDLHGHGCVDREAVESVSGKIRGLLTDGCPELVSAAESFGSEVRYFPVSALGKVPTLGPKGLAVRPCELKPSWVTVPVLYGLCRWLKGTVPAVKVRTAGQTPAEGTPRGSRQTPAGGTPAARGGSAP